MGGVLNISCYGCIHDSNFTDDCKDKENIETIKQEALNLGGHAIDRVSSFITEYSPSRKCSKKTTPIK